MVKLNKPKKRTELNQMSALTSLRTKILDTAYLHDISDGNEEFIQEVLTTFQEEAKDFQIRIRQHFHQRDFYSLRKASHAMKPTGSYIGVNALTTLITNLEKAAPAGDLNLVGNLILEVEKIITVLNADIETYLASMKKP